MRSETQATDTERGTARDRSRLTQGRKDRKIILKYVNFARRKVEAKRRKKSTYIPMSDWLVPWTDDDDAGGSRDREG